MAILTQDSDVVDKKEEVDDDEEDDDEEEDDEVEYNDEFFSSIEYKYSKLNKYEKLEVYNNGILNLQEEEFKDEDLVKILKMMENYPKIISLNLSHTKIYIKACQILASNRTIQKVNLDNCNIGDKEATIIAQNKTITFLNVSRNNIGSTGAEALAENTTITTLIIGGGNHIGACGFRALSLNKIITHLDVRSYYSPFPERDRQNRSKVGQKALKYLSENKTILRLFLHGCNINSSGAKILAKNKSITHLELSSNYINDAGCKALAQNEHLQILNLTYNDDITMIGYNSFAENKTLRVLMLPDIRENAKIRKSLTTHNVQHNVQETGDIAEAFYNNTTLIFLSYVYDDKLQQHIYSNANAYYRKIKSINEFICNSYFPPVLGYIIIKYIGVGKGINLELDDYESEDYEIN